MKCKTTRPNIELTCNNIAKHFYYSKYALPNILCICDFCYTAAGQAWREDTRDYRITEEEYKLRLIKL